MDKRQEILEAIQDGLETGEVFLTDIPEKNKDIFADPELSEQFKRLAENLTGKREDSVPECGGKDENDGTAGSDSNAAAVKTSCGDSSKAAAGGCAACGFKCSMAKLSSSSDIPGDDPFAERNPTKMDEPPLPETTFPMPQVLLAVTACIAGCYFAERIISSLLGR
ncbi:MAG: hypothetical protein Q4D40_02460 [Eubacteriales bacterium]|nr:hypothetical protein [Eubacteriales bacterium]